MRWEWGAESIPDRNHGISRHVQEDAMTTLGKNKGSAVALALATVEHSRGGERGKVED